MVDRRPLDDFDLLAYVDGRLDGDPARKAAVEDWLGRSPEQAARARLYQAQNEALRRAYGGRIHDPVPERLLAALEDRHRRRGRQALAAAVLVMVTAVASVSGWLLGRGAGSGDWSPRDFVQENYREFINAASEAPMAQNGQGEPLSWLAEEISLTLRAPDLSDEGYAIIDKRTVSDGRHRMVRLVYAAPDGRSFSLFLRPRWTEREHPLRMATQHDVSLAYWFEGPLASAIASRLPPEETRAIAEAVRGALLDPRVSQPAMTSEPAAASRQQGDLATVPVTDQNPLLPDESVTPAAGTPQVVPN